MQSIQITSTSDSDQRIDKFLKKYLPNLPLGGLYKTLRTGKIKVNRKKIDPTYRLQLDDTVEFFFHDDAWEALIRESIDVRNISPPK